MKEIFDRYLNNLVANGQSRLTTAYMKSPMCTAPFSLQYACPSAKRWYDCDIHGYHWKSWGASTCDSIPCMRPFTNARLTESCP